MHTLVRSGKSTTAIPIWGGVSQDACEAGPRLVPLDLPAKERVQADIGRASADPLDDGTIGLGWGTDRSGGHSRG
jgi:hypothetical protein